MAAAAVIAPPWVFHSSLPSSVEIAPSSQYHTWTEAQQHQRDISLEVLKWRMRRELSLARLLTALAQAQDTKWRNELQRRRALATISATNDERSSFPLEMASSSSCGRDEDILSDASPDYTSTDALATVAAQIIIAPPSAPHPPYGPLPAPSPPSSSPPSIKLLERDHRRAPKIDFSNTDHHIREHKKKKKPAQKTAAWAQSDDEGDKKKKGDEGASGDGGGDGGGGGGADGGDDGGGDGGGDDNGDGGDDWNDAGGGKKDKKKKKKKGKEEEEEEEKKKAEEEADAAAAEADAGANDAWGDPAAGKADANPDDDWGGFTTAKGKKKNKKKVSKLMDPHVILLLGATACGVSGEIGDGLAGAKIAYQIVATECGPHLSTSSTCTCCSR